MSKVVSEDGVREYSPTSTGSSNKQQHQQQQQQQQQQANHNGGGLPAFGQRFGVHASSASAYTSAGGSSRPSSSSYHPITTSGVGPYHLTVNSAAGTPDGSSFQWGGNAHPGYPNTDGTINYVHMPNSKMGRNRASGAPFSAAASLSAREYLFNLFCHFLYNFSEDRGPPED